MGANLLYWQFLLKSNKPSYILINTYIERDTQCSHTKQPLRYCCSHPITPIPDDAYKVQGEAGTGQRQLNLHSVTF